MSALRGERVGAAVTVVDVSRHFRTDAGVVRAVDEVSLELAAGASLAVEGRSGSGKSTLLSLIGALELPTSGRVHIAGLSVSEMSRAERARVRRENIGFVFQNDDLQPFLTAGENVALAMSLAGSRSGYQRAYDLLDELGLVGLAGRYPDELSGGERQRVAVARALVHGPRLILADEPTGALDSRTSETVIDLLLAAQAETGATLLIITHDPAVADRLEQRMVLSDGRVQSDDPSTAVEVGGSPHV